MKIFNKPKAENMIKRKQSSDEEYGKENIVKMKEFGKCCFMLILNSIREFQKIPLSQDHN